MLSGRPFAFDLDGGVGKMASVTIEVSLLDCIALARRPCGAMVKVYPETTKRTYANQTDLEKAGFSGATLAHAVSMMRTHDLTMCEATGALSFKPKKGSTMHTRDEYQALLLKIEESNGPIEDAEERIDDIRQSLRQVRTLADGVTGETMIGEVDGLHNAVKCLQRAEAYASAYHADLVKARAKLLQTAHGAPELDGLPHGS